MKFKRKELQGIRTKANQEGDIGHLNPVWKRAYENLASAADHLDAMIARCTEEKITK